MPLTLSVISNTLSQLIVFNKTKRPKSVRFWEWDCLAKCTITESAATQNRSG
jgi:hypothetical protein